REKRDDFSVQRGPAIPRRSDERSRYPNRGAALCFWPNVWPLAQSVEQRPGSELLDRDHADARERPGERADVVLEVEQLDALDLREQAARHLAEADHADPAARVGEHERLDLGREVAVVAGQQQVAVP